jgi:hypothetical protein
MTDDGGLRVLPGGRDDEPEEEIVYSAGQVVSDLLRANQHLQRDIERLKRREKTRNTRARRLAIVCALVASAATWGVAHAQATTDAATTGGTLTHNTCRSQHVHDCVRALNWWRKVEREARDAIAWQKHERLRMARQLLGDVSSWTCIHQHEGAWNSNTGNGYHGGLQMDVSFMRTYGPDMIRKYGGYAENWAPKDQIIVAQRAYRTRGYHPWPNTARACGVL